MITRARSTVAVVCSLALSCGAGDAFAAAACISDPGSITFNANSIVDIEIGGTDACTGYDRFSVGGKLTLNGATLRVTIINGFTLAAGQSFDVLDWGTLAGTFGSVQFVNSTLPQGASWDQSALYTTGVLTITAPATSSKKVPVPLAALASLGLGLILISRHRG